MKVLNLKWKIFNEKNTIKSTLSLLGKQYSITASYLLLYMNITIINILYCIILLIHIQENTVLF
jgi:predicted signal transduction protein with EAL and GGDEF domain